ncbi:hypothetical protein KC19_VG286000 [Ceratodon purpureus]|uniref:Uncharacterized protein n=1 Tax=Ceratodon purpureus TaxID=3225 RepID=A0A8T0HVH3_CERPU|nr:hypothetical protein KC19_VG286000 [Ceratodon purpureus]
MAFARRKAEWEPWFSRCMLLSASRFIPSDPNAKEVSPSADVVAMWDPKTGAGYSFKDRNGEEYYGYVCELFLRVHQRPMQDGTLPLHFARGLLEEEKGNSVNWTKFAMRRCFPGQKRRPFQPWPKYENVRGPLPSVHP